MEFARAETLFEPEEAQGPARWRVSISGVRFTNADTHWAVLSVTDGKRDGCAVGVMLDPQVGHNVTLVGEWIEAPKYGEQFKFASYEPELPKDKAEAEAYLASGIVKGIGPATARAIADYFGDDTLDILNEDIERLQEVPNIGAKKLAVIRQGWEETTAQRAVAIALIAVGASGSLAGPIWNVFGADGIKIIHEQPYALTKARGVGFTTCDQIAFRLGWSRTDPRRLAAGLAYALEKAEQSGHCYLPVPDVIEFAADRDVLDVHVDAVADAIALAVEDDHIVVDSGRAYTPRLHYVETDLAQQLSRIALAPLAKLKDAEAAKVAELVAQESLTDEQASVVDRVIAAPLVVLTGGPGVGKSHTVKTVVEVADLLGWRVALCAPTGRAAQRMSELADGFPAMTVHRLLGIGGEGGCDFGEDNPLLVELLVCDETSMLDVSIARLLARAIRTGTRVLFVGDRDQLPSVGPGAVLSDLIASGIAPTVALTQIFRQKEGSGIVQVAHAINEGRIPELFGWEDLHYWPTPKPEPSPEALFAWVSDRVIDMVVRHIPAKFSVPSTDIQVLVPQQKGSCGRIALNTRLQDAINPRTGPQYETTINGVATAFRVGDRAMVIKNNYDKDLFNGTPVRVVAVNPEGGKTAVTVRTEDGYEAVYEASEVHELSLAYAITIHKSQGSQYPCVVMPVVTQAYRMLLRNLLYTGVTRAQDRVVLIGQGQAIAKAIRTKDTAVRFTGLEQRLRLNPT